MFKRIKQGFKDITLQQQLEAKKIGLYGQITGMLLAGGVICVFKGMWWWSLLFAASIFIFYLELITVNKQLDQAKKMNKLTGWNK